MRGRERRSRLELICSLALLIVMIGFAVLGSGLASQNRSPGTPDSQNNLDTARNLATGAGFTTHIVQQLFVAQRWPNPETIRPPGVPFVVAAAFRLFGVKLEIPVFINVFTVLISAALLNAAIRRVAPHARWFADCAAIILLVTPVFEMVSIWNNGFLVLTNAALLLVASRALTGVAPPTRLLVAGGLVCAFGVLMKPSYLVTSVPFGFLMALHGERGDARITAKRLGVFFGVLGLATSPYWIRNLYLFHEPLHSPWRDLRLDVRYGGLPAGPWWTVRFNRPVTYKEILGIFGFSALVDKEWNCWWRPFKALMQLNEPISVLFLGGLLLTFRRATRARHAAGIVALFEPWFTDAVYWTHELRYLWPAFPCFLFIGAVAIEDVVSSGIQSAYARGLRRVLAVTTCAALWVGGTASKKAWNAWFASTKASPPGWVRAVSELPRDSVVLTDDPWLLAWYGRRRSVVCPGGSREDLARVLAVYHPTHLLMSGPGCGWRPVKMLPSDSRTLATGSGWRLSELTSK